MQQFLHQTIVPCILDRLPSQHDFLPTRLKTGYHGDNLYSNSSPRVKLGVMSNRICGSNGSVQQADSSLREKASLCESRVTHKILNTCYCPIHLPMVDSNPIERHNKDGMQLWRITHHRSTDAVNWKIWQQHTCKTMRRPIWFWHSMMQALFKFREERKPGWLQNAKTLSIGSRDLLPLNLTSRCSRTNKWNSAFAGSISDPLTEPGSSSPSRRCPKRWKNG